MVRRRMDEHQRDLLIGAALVVAMVIGGAVYVVWSSLVTMFG